MELHEVILALVAAAALAVAVARWTAGSGAGGQRRPIPAPFPFWSDMLVWILLNGRFPDTVGMHARYGPLFRWRFIGTPTVMVGGLENVKAVLNGEGTLARACYPRSVQKLLGPWAIINISGQQHVRIKRLAQAAFTPQAVRAYLPRMQAIAEEAVRKWAAAGDILAYEEMKWFTFRVAVEVTLGCDDGWTGPQHFPAVSAEFEAWLQGLFSFPVALPGTAFHRAMRMRGALLRRIHASMDLLAARQADEPGAGAASVLGRLMASRDEHGRGLSREQVADTVLVLLFAGHDTSATSLARILQHLHARPEAAARLREEQAAVVAAHGADIGEAALADMPYAEGVVREALRISPIVNGVLRVAVRDFELAGHTIPAGTTLQCSLGQPLKTDARWRDEANPLAFRPERWLGGAAAKQGGWVPFGGGARLCLGWLLAMAEMKVLLAALFRGHAVELREADEPWAPFPIARPKHGMPARCVAVPAAAAS